MTWRTLAALCILAAAIMACCAVIAQSFYLSVDFDPRLLSKDAAAGRGTIFMDRYGRELRFLPDGRGERARWVPLADMPDIVKNAFIAAEDERFYRHHGFDSAAILRAFWSNITKRRIVSGASTISQQVVRLAYQNAAIQPDESEGGKVGKRRTYRDKLVEVMRSIKLERAFSKAEILEHYLNRVPMGNNLVGVETAARAYFGTTVRNLSASEAALLASLPKAPGMLNPYGNELPRLVERRNWVIGRMESLGLLTHDRAMLARQEELRLRKLSFASAAPHVVDMLLKRGASGARVRTTLDLDLEIRVQEILASHGPRLKNRGASQAAAIVIHNPTMEVLAAAGSVEYSNANGGFNNGVLAQRSAGSTLKPFLYALALEQGESATSLIEDTERTYRSREGQYVPLNFDRREYGPVTVRSALGSSLNLSAVKMLQRVGEEEFYDLLLRLRLINRPELGPGHYGLGMAIGNPEVSPEQLATAYAALANYGEYRPATYVLGGKGPAAARAKRFLFLPQTAFIVTDMLSDPTARVLTFNRSRMMMDVPFRVAVKTGTSTFFRDLWAVGYTPDYTVAVWVGNFDGSPTMNLSGSTAAMPIFTDIITWLYRTSEPGPFPRPKGIRRVRVCGYSGMRPSEHCPHTLKELYIAGTEPRETCTFHGERPQRHELAASYAGWLYDKNRTGSAGKFRLAGFEDDLGRVFQDPWDGVPAMQREPAVRLKGGMVLQTASLRADAADGRRPGHYSIGGKAVASPGVAAGEGEIKITYPLDHDQFVLNRYDRKQVIKLQAVVASPVAYVDWFVNGTLYKRTAPPYQTYWPLEEGRFRVTAVTPSNAGDSVQVTVE